MSIVSNSVGSEVASSLLVGAKLDTFRVYSLIIQLGFVRIGASVGAPTEIWVSASGSIIVKELSAGVELQVPMDFFERRALALCEIYRLIGKEVTAIHVLEVGTLQIDLGGKKLEVKADEDCNLEEIWSVMSDSPDTHAAHRWHLSFDDTGVLSAIFPD